VTGLTNGTAYTFRVAATNPSGTSAFSAASNAVTPQGVAPTAPAAPTATAGNGQATVNWAPPSSTGGSAITGYTLRVFSGTTQVGADRILGNIGSTAVTGLTNGTAYTFRVAARNAVGTSAFSTASAPVTPRAATTDTTAPTNGARTPLPAATGVSRTANVTTTFNEPVLGVSGTTFTLRPATGGANIGAVVSYNTTSRVATLNPGVTLAANTRYTVTVTGGATAIRDTSGNPLVTNSWNFTTGAA
jgi:hypothetical protein